jgi:hypothetical protein
MKPTASVSVSGVPLRLSGAVSRELAGFAMYAVHDLRAILDLFAFSFVLLPFAGLVVLGLVFDPAAHTRTLSGVYR